MRTTSVFLRLRSRTRASSPCSPTGGCPKPPSTAPHEFSTRPYISGTSAPRRSLWMSLVRSSTPTGFRGSSLNSLVCRTVLRPCRCGRAELVNARDRLHERDSGLYRGGRSSFAEGGCPRGADRTDSTGQCDRGVEAEPAGRPPAGCDECGDDGGSDGERVLLACQRAYPCGGGLRESCARRVGVVRSHAVRR
jgi:hypothetical protein